MATVSFKNKKEKEEEVAEKKPAVEENLPAKVEETAVAERREPMDFTAGGVTGDMELVSLSPPYIGIVQGVGDLSMEFDPGAIIFNKEILMNPAPHPVGEWSDPLPFSVLAGKLQFKENLDYDSEDMPEVVDSLEEVQDRGGWIEWRTDDQGRRVEPPWLQVFTALCLFEANTEESENAFSILDPNDKPCEMGVWRMQKSSFSRAAKFILGRGRGALRNRETGEMQLHHGKFTVQIRREKLGQYQVFVPKVRMVGKHTPEYVEFLESLL